MVTTEPTDEQMEQMAALYDEDVYVLYYAGHDRVDVAYKGSRVEQFEDAGSVDGALAFAEGFAAGKRHE